MDGIGSETIESEWVSREQNKAVHRKLRTKDDFFTLYKKNNILCSFLSDLVLYAVFGLSMFGLLYRKLNTRYFYVLAQHKKGCNVIGFVWIYFFSVLNFFFAFFLFAMKKNISIEPTQIVRRTALQIKKQMSKTGVSVVVCNAEI